MDNAKSFMVDYEKALNCAMLTYRKCQKDVQFDKHFSMRGVPAEYDIHYGILTGRMRGARERHEVHARA